MPAPAVAAVGLGLQAVSFVGQRRAAKDANRAIESQNIAAEQRRQAEERRQALQRRRERFRLLSEARRQRASVVAGAAQRVGVTGLTGSGVQGAQAVVQSRLASALGYQSALAASGRELSAASAAFASAGGDLSRAQRNAGLFSGIGSLGGSIRNVSTSPALKTIFNGISGTTSKPSVGKDFVDWYQ